MSKPRRMLSDIEIPAISELFKLIPTQSKATVARWAVDYATRVYMPIWDKHFPSDTRPQKAIAAACECLDGKIKVAELKERISDCKGIAHDADKNPTAQAAVRAIVDCGVGSVWSSSKSIGIALYGALAVAYDKLGVTASREALNDIAVAECGQILAALQAIAIENEPNPCKVSWEC